MVDGLNQHRTLSLVMTLGYSSSILETKQPTAVWMFVHAECMKVNAECIKVNAGKTHENNIVQPKTNKWRSSPSYFPSFFTV